MLKNSKMRFSHPQYLLKPLVTSYPTLQKYFVYLFNVFFLVFNFSISISAIIWAFVTTAVNSCRDQSISLDTNLSLSIYTDFFNSFYFHFNFNASLSITSSSILACHALSQHFDRIFLRVNASHWGKW